MNPKVSIIVPVFQAEDTIERCIKSLINQSYENIEVVLIDDGSSDNSADKCVEWERKDNRVKLVCMNQNKGVSVARNRGLDSMTGDYFCFLDSDDYLEEDMIRSMVEKALSEASDICICGFKRENYGKIIKEINSVQICAVSIEDFFYEYFWLLFNNHILHNIGTKLYKKRIVDDNQIRFNEEIGIKEDISFALEYLKHCEVISSVSESYYIYTSNEKSIMHNYVKNYDAGLKYYANIILNMDCLDEEIVHYSLMKDSFGLYIVEMIFPKITIKGISKLNSLVCDNYSWKNLNKPSDIEADIGRDEKMYIFLLRHKLKLCLTLLGLWKRYKYIRSNNK